MAALKTQIAGLHSHRLWFRKSGWAQDLAFLTSFQMVMLLLVRNHTLSTNASISGLANFFYTAPDSKYFKRNLGQYVDKWVLLCFGQILFQHSFTKGTWASLDFGILAGGGGGGGILRLMSPGTQGMTIFEFYIIFTLWNNILLKMYEWLKINNHSCGSYGNRLGSGPFFGLWATVFNPCSRETQMPPLAQPEAEFSTFLPGSAWTWWFVVA